MKHRTRLTSVMVAILETERKGREYQAIFKLVNVVAEKTAVVEIVVNTAPQKCKLQVLNAYTLLSDMITA